MTIGGWLNYVTGKLGRGKKQNFIHYYGMISKLHDESKAQNSSYNLLSFV